MRKLCRNDDIVVEKPNDKPEEKPEEKKKYLPQVYIKQLGGDVFALDLNLDILNVKDVKKIILDRTREVLMGMDGGDEIFNAEEFLWQSGRLGLTFQGKSMPNDSLLKDLGVAKGTTLTVTYGLYGEGKRGKAEVDDVPVTKGDVVEEVFQELEKLKANIGDTSGDDVLHQVATSINALMNRIGNNPKASQLIFRAMSKENMIRIKDVMDSKGGDQKVNTIKKVIYTQELAAINKKEELIGSVKEALKVSTKYMLVKGNANSAGVISWEALKEFLEEEIQKCDLRAGAAMALQAQAQAQAQVPQNTDAA